MVSGRCVIERQRQGAGGVPGGEATRALYDAVVIGGRARLAETRVRRRADRNRPLCAGEDAGPRAGPAVPTRSFAAYAVRAGIGRLRCHFLKIQKN